MNRTYLSSRNQSWSFPWDSGALPYKLYCDLWQQADYIPFLLFEFRTSPRNILSPLALLFLITSIRRNLSGVPGETRTLDHLIWCLEQELNPYTPPFRGSPLLFLSYPSKSQVLFQLSYRYRSPTKAVCWHRLRLLGSSPFVYYVENSGMALSPRLVIGFLFINPLHTEGLAPRAGLEPATLWLTVKCSTYWANEEYNMM